jgi:hypothetical protein
MKDKSFADKDILEDLTFVENSLQKDAHVFRYDARWVLFDKSDDSSCSVRLMYCCKS